MKVFLVFASLLVATVLAAPGITDNRIDSDNTDSTVSKILGHCVDSTDVVTCMTIKGITALNRAVRSNNIEIAPGMTFTRDPQSSVRSGKAISESDVLSGLPKEPEEKMNKLLELAAETVTEFLSTHNLQVKIPPQATQELARSLEEGRGKMKKMMGPLMMALGAKLIAIVPIIFGGLALLATKALIVAKIAFLLAISLGASKLFGGSNVLGKFGGAGQAVNAGWSSGGNGWSSGSYPYARSLDAHDLAYSGQALVDTNAQE